MKPPADRLTASEFVAETLRREILRGELSPGQPLLQDHIAARFDVSQSSVREALRRLESQALVESVRNRGTFVATLTIGQIEEMYQIRLAIELIALRHNFANLDLRAARELLAEMAKDPETAFFLGETHKKFHAVFYDSPDRKLGKDILQNIYGNLTRVWVSFVRSKPSQARRYEGQSRQQHHDLLRAAEAQDLPAAEAILTQHINNARDLLVEYLRQVDAASPDEAGSAGTGRRARQG